MITGYWQTDKRLLQDVQTFGCAFLDSLYLLPDDITPDQANAAWLLARHEGYINAKLEILWEPFLQSLVSNETVMRYPLSFVRKASSTYVCEANERELLKWYLSNVNEDHFTVGDGASRTVWDSMNRPDIMAKYAAFVEKVIVRVG